MKLPPVISTLALAAALSAHPMGNFSVNHYSRLNFHASGADLTYILDIAEIPTFQLFQEWKVDANDQMALQTAVRTHANEWVANLAITANGKAAGLRVKSVEAATADGAGSMPILRITIRASVPASAGKIIYEDKNFAGRAGWKEIVVTHDGGAQIRQSSRGATDLSDGLTRYPASGSITPPQDLTARVEWAPTQVSAQAKPVVKEPAPAPSEAPRATFAEQQPSAPGTVVRGDYLSRLLGRKDLGAGLILFGLLAAFGLGAMHAMSPGHGKTIVAAYLVGSRGTMKHAALLGVVVTATHTFTVFLLGIGVLFFQKYVVPEKIVPVLGAVSGLSIVCVGASLLRSRIQTRRRRKRRGSINLDEHSHAPAIEGGITRASLIALGVSGGMVPCPSALVLMLSAIALGRPALGMILLIGFSLGLAMVLMGVGFAAVRAKSLLPSTKAAMDRPAVRLIPVFSAVVVICLGLAMTAVSAGWIQPLKFLS